MKRNLLLGITFIGAIALSSCSVNKTASNSQNNDDVYFSRAKAAEEPEYVTRNNQYDQDGADQYSDEDDYFYYDDYASRINRFSYYSPFGYYDNLYSPYGYGGYGNGWNVGLGFGYGGYGYGGWGGYGGFGLGWGGGYGWGSPWGYSPFGYGGFYSPYSFWGGGYGYGWGGGYWGGYSAFRSNPRPYRGNGSNTSFANRGRTAYGGNNNGIGYIPNRATRGVSNGGNGRPVYGDTRATRGVRTDRPTYQPSVERSAPSSFGGGGGGRSSGGGGGGRPVRN
ncbi:hypothetical protein [Mucilaginibacter phyllosphaerae]|uniref:Prolyl-tRNA synthetase n=1 Tax=Mucilaginibacter phyllosphaerae TaxID=1812349 RepID=A0A4Y8A5L7_9SPHI|nr:hypothetical protein [Mucilaginibacter phyllosphaerae]MBB3969543.1 hypothetical protein [Mucilaginibacter phyllosphaerae]TEW63640.1 hypothetical protein E2R65_19430 [Mucilaginibacter phyllosphaerae]GGH23755.1 hypothetical protein GCM10007352_37830 [Mucilaginibacter phyllosphaerae]